MNLLSWPCRSEQKRNDQWRWGRKMPVQIVVNRLPMRSMKTKRGRNKSKGISNRWNSLLMQLILPPPWDISSKRNRHHRWSITGIEKSTTLTSMSPPRTSEVERVNDEWSVSTNFDWSIWRSEWRELFSLVSRRNGEQRSSSIGNNPRLTGTKRIESLTMHEFRLVGVDESFVVDKAVKINEMNKCFTRLSNRSTRNFSLNCVNCWAESFLLSFTLWSDFLSLYRTSTLLLSIDRTRFEFEHRLTNFRWNSIWIEIESIVQSRWALANDFIEDFSKKFSRSCSKCYDNENNQNKNQHWQVEISPNDGTKGFSRQCETEK